MSGCEPRSKVQFTLIAKSRPHSKFFRNVLVLVGDGYGGLEVRIACAVPYDAYRRVRITWPSDPDAQEEARGLVAWSELPKVSEVQLDWDLVPAHERGGT